MKTIDDYTPAEWYALAHDERERLYFTPDNLNKELEASLRWLARHTCRARSGKCNACGPTIAAINELRKLGAKLPSELKQKQIDPFNEWFQRNWAQLLREFFINKPSMIFDAFCDMKFANRSEEIARTYYT